MEEFEYNDESDGDEEWLRKAKENPIAKQLLERLKIGGKFCKN